MVQPDSLNAGLTVISLPVASRRPPLRRKTGVSGIAASVKATADGKQWFDRTRHPRLRWKWHVSQGEVPWPRVLKSRRCLLANENADIPFAPSPASSPSDTLHVQHLCDCKPCRTVVKIDGTLMGKCGESGGMKGKASKQSSPKKSGD